MECFLWGWLSHLCKKRFLTQACSNKIKLPSEKRFVQTFHTFCIFECFKKRTRSLFFPWYKCLIFLFINMARVESSGKYQLPHRIKYRSITRGHHIYKVNWTPIISAKCFAKPDGRDEVLEYDKFAIGIYKENKDGKSELTGHAPMELSSLLYHFLNADLNNFISATVTGKRKYEIGVVVPAKNDCYTEVKRISFVLDER